MLDVKPASAALLALAWTLAPQVATAASVNWTLVLESAVVPGTNAVAFLDDRTGLTTGCSAPVFRTFDGGASWSPRSMRHVCRYGLEMVPGLTVNTGNTGITGEVFLSTDDGAHWQRGARFGDWFPHHVRSLSFIDPKRGAIATDEWLALTHDAASTWQRLLPPEKATTVAAVSLADDAGHLVLRIVDEGGCLWRSDDVGRTWAAAPSPLRKPVLQATSGATAALRFVGSEGVLAATLDDGGDLAGHVYRTRDGGSTWVEETLSVPFRAAAVGISADGALLSALDPVASTVKVYRAR